MSKRKTFDETITEFVDDNVQISEESLITKQRKALLQILASGEEYKPSKLSKQLIVPLMNAAKHQRKAINAFRKHFTIKQLIDKDKGAT